MISLQSLPNDEKQILREQIIDDLCSVVSDCSEHEPWLEDLAEGIAAFCEQVACSEASLSREYYGLVVSRALWAVGEQKAARSILSQKCGTDAIVLCTPFAHTFNRFHLWPISYSGIVRRSVLVSEGGDYGWVLDFNRMEFRDEDALEITVFAVLQRLLFEMAHVWDERSGRGWLAVKGIMQLEKSMLGPAKQKVYRRLHKDLIRQCERCLEHCRNCRGWSSVPMVKELIA